MDRPEPTVAAAHGEAGLTLVELLITVAVLGIVTLVILPRVACHLQQSHMVSVLSDLNAARDAVELYEMEFGDFPNTLADAFEGRQLPATVILCPAGDTTGDCKYFEPTNPNLKSNSGTNAGGYYLRTSGELAICRDIDFAWLSCCGMEPVTVDVATSALHG